MHSTANNLSELLTEFPLETRKMVQAAWSEAAGQLTPGQLTVWLEGAGDWQAPESVSAHW